MTSFEICVVMLTLVIVVIIWKLTDYAIANGGFKRVKDYKFKAVLYRKEHTPEVTFRAPGCVIDGKNVEWEVQEDLESNSVIVRIKARFDRYDLLERM